MAGKGFKLILNSSALNELLVEHAAPVLEEAAKEVASRIRMETNIVNGVNRSGRPFSMVLVVDKLSLIRQARDGVITRAAAESGLDVHRYAID